MRATNPFPRSRLPLDDIKRMLDAAVQKGVRVVSFTGGEPLLHLKDLAHLIHYAGRAGIEYIRTGTNGFLFARPDRPDFRSRVQRVVDTLADTPLRNFWISIDSCVPEVHEDMRGFPGVIQGLERCLPWFHESGLFPSANLGINRNVGGKATRSARIRTGDRDERAWFNRTYQEAFRSFYRFVEGLGFTMVNSCYPMSIEPGENGDGLKPVYEATSQEDLVHYSHREKAELFEVLFRVIPEFRHRVRIFSPRISLRTLSRTYRGCKDTAYPCRGGLDAFFVDSRDGNTYPCGFRGEENLGPFWKLPTNPPVRKGGCTLCDWECFRDPSELFGPLLQARSAPLELVRKLRLDPAYFRLWREDLAYYRACDFFDGRRPPNLKKMARFSQLNTTRDTASLSVPGKSATNDRFRYAS
jgi:MoaA/NifB/PqqE/SkfB family radical SAM enzyme